MKNKINLILKIFIIFMSIFYINFNLENWIVDAYIKKELKEHKIHSNDYININNKNEKCHNVLYIKGYSETDIEMSYNLNKHISKDKCINLMSFNYINKQNIITKSKLIDNKIIQAIKDEFGLPNLIFASSCGNYYIKKLNLPKEIKVINIKQEHCPFYISFILK